MWLHAREVSCLCCYGCRSMIMAAKRNVLNLKKKIEVLDVAEKNKKLGVRGLAEMFNCGKTQISSILKNKQSIREMYEANLSNESLKLRKRTRSSEYSEINEALYKWYTLACSRNIYPNGEQFREKARQIAKQLDCRQCQDDDVGDDSEDGATGFKASNGWLDRWKKRYNYTSCGHFW